MLLKDHQNYIKNAKNDYKKIGYVKCPAFNNEKVYFNKHGFRHLIWKRKYPRNISEQVERLELLKYASEIIGTSNSFVDYNKNIYPKLGRGGITADFWSLMKIRDGIKIIVVIRQIKGGIKHFFSIMKG